MSDATAPRALLAAPAKAAPPPSQLIIDVAREYGVSPLKQFGQMLRLWAGNNRMEFAQYYNNACYRKDLSADQRQQFVGEMGSFRLNLRLSPKGVTELRPFVRDKVFYGATLEKLGFPTPPIQAVASGHRRYGNTPVLQDVAEIEAFLQDTARYPLFVKPEEGSGSVGSALIVALDAKTRELELSNGTRIDLRAFAEEAMESYSEGLLFQDAIVQHEALSKVAGRAVGTIRVVTVCPDGEPETLYTVWKIPSPKAMSDNYWQSGSMIGEIDTASGVLKQCRRGAGPDQEIVERHPVSDMAFEGLQMPHWDEVLRVTREAHALTPQFGVFGWDVAITETGPVIIECNANPHHMLYQLATGDGILNDRFAPIFDRVAERAKRLTAERRAKHLRILKTGH